MMVQHNWDAILEAKLPRSRQIIIGNHSCGSWETMQQIVERNLDNFDSLTISQLNNITVGGKSLKDQITEDN